MSDAGALLREVRARHGVGQKQLAMRASTTQSAISRIERGQVSPTVKTLEELIYLLGEDLEFEARPRKVDMDLVALEERLRLTPGERVERGLAEAEKMLKEQRS